MAMKLKAAYLNPYEHAYNQVKNTQFFNENDWRYNMNKSEQDLQSYISLVSDADKKLSFDELNEQYMFNRMDTDMRQLLLYNKMYADKSEDSIKDREFVTGYDDAGNEIKTYEKLSDYDYYDKLLKMWVTDQHERDLASQQIIKKQNQHWAKKLFNTIIATGGEFIGGAYDATMAFFDLFDAIATYDYSDGMDGFAEYLREELSDDDIGQMKNYSDDFMEELAKWEYNNTYFYDAYGDITWAGKYVGNTANSIGRMIPGILTGNAMAGAGGVFASLAPAAQQTVYYSSMASKNLQETFRNPNFDNVSAELILGKVVLETQLDYMVEMASAKLFGASMLDRLSLGLTPKISGSNVWSRLIKDALVEGSEEVVQEFTSVFASNMAAGWNRNDPFYVTISGQTMVDAFICGALSSIVTGGFNEVVNKIKTNIASKKFIKGDENLNIQYEKLIATGKKKDAKTYRYSIYGFIQAYQTLMTVIDTSTKEGREFALDLSKQAFQSYQAFMTIYQTIGENRVKEAELLLSKLETEINEPSKYNFVGGKKALHGNNFAFDEGAEKVRRFASTLKDKLGKTPLTEHLINSINARGKDVTRTPEQLGDLIAYYDANADKLIEAVKTQSKVTETGLKMAKQLAKDYDMDIILTDNTNFIAEENGTLFIPIEDLNNMTAKQILKGAATEKIVMQLIKKMPKSILNEIVSTYEQLVGKKNSSQVKAVYSLLYNSTFYNVLLRNSDKDMYSFLSLLDNIAAELSNKNTNKDLAAEYMDVIRTVRKTMGASIVSYLLNNPKASLEAITVLNDTQKAFVIEHRYNAMLADRLINNENVTEKDLNVIHNRINSLPITKNEKETLYANITSKERNVRIKAINELDERYNYIFNGKYNDKIYFASTDVKSCLFNEFAKSLGIDLRNLTENRAAPFDNELTAEGKPTQQTRIDYIRQKFEIFTNNNYTLQVVKSKNITEVVIEEKDYKYEYDYEYGYVPKLSDLRKEGQLNSYTYSISGDYETIRPIVNNLLAKGINDVERSYITVSDVINSPNTYLSDKVKDEIKTMYGVVNKNSVYDYLYSFILEATSGSTGLSFDSQGNAITVTYKNMAHFYKDTVNDADPNKTDLYDKYNDAEEHNITELFNDDVVVGELKNVKFVVKSSSSSTYVTEDNLITIGRKDGKKMSNAEFKYALMHEFNHAMQHFNGRVEGMTDDFQVPNNVVEDIERHVPDLFDDIDKTDIKKYIKEKQNRAVDFIYYNTLGELESYGMYNKDTTVYPIIVNNVGNYTVVTMPWGSKYTLKIGNNGQSYMAAKQLVDIDAERIVNEPKADVEPYDYPLRRELLEKFNKIKNVYKFDNAYDLVNVSKIPRLREYNIDYERHRLKQQEKLNEMIDDEFYTVVTQWETTPFAGDSHFDRDKFVRLIPEDFRLTSLKLLYYTLKFDFNRIDPKLEVFPDRFKRFLNMDIPFVRYQVTDNLYDSKFVSVVVNPTMELISNLFHFGHYYKPKGPMTNRQYLISGTFKPKDLSLYIPNGLEEGLINPNKLSNLKVYEVTATFDDDGDFVPLLIGDDGKTLTVQDKHIDDMTADIYNVYTLDEIKEYLKTLDGGALFDKYDYGRYGYDSWEEIFEDYEFNYGEIAYEMNKAKWPSKITQKAKDLSDNQTVKKSKKKKTVTKAQYDEAVAYIDKINDALHIVKHGRKDIDERLKALDLPEDIVKAIKSNTFVKSADKKYSNYLAIKGRYEALERAKKVRNKRAQELKDRGMTYNYVFVRKKDLEGDGKGTALEYYEPGEYPRRVSYQTFKFLKSITKEELSKLPDTLADDIVKGELTQDSVYDFIRNAVDIDKWTFNKIKNAYFPDSPLESWDEVDAIGNANLSLYYAIWAVMRQHGFDDIVNDKLTYKLKTEDDYNYFAKMTLEKIPAFKKEVDAVQARFTVYGRTYKEINGVKTVDRPGVDLEIDFGQARLSALKRYDGTIASLGSVAGIAKGIAIAGYNARSKHKETSLNAQIDATESDGDTFEEVLAGINESQEDVVSLASLRKGIRTHFSNYVYKVDKIMASSKVEPGVKKKAIFKLCKIYDSNFANMSKEERAAYASLLAKKLFVDKKINERYLKQMLEKYEQYVDNLTNDEVKRLAVLYEISEETGLDEIIESRATDEALKQESLKRGTVTRKNVRSSFVAKLNRNADLINHINWKYIPDEYKKYFDPDNGYKFRMDLITNTKERKVSADEISKINDELTPFFANLRKGNYDNAKSAKLAAQLDKEIRKNLKLKQQLLKAKLGTSTKVDKPTYVTTLNSNKTFQMHSNVEMPSVLKGILETTFDETATSTTKFLAKEDEKHMRISGKKLIQQNAEALSTMTPEDVTQAIQFYENAIYDANVSHEDIVRYDSFKIALFAYWYEEYQSGELAISDDTANKIRDMSKLAVESAATVLATWRSVLNSFNYKKVITKAMMAKDITIDEKDLDRIAEAIENGDIDELDEIRKELKDKYLAQYKDRNKVKKAMDRIFTFQKAAMLSAPATTIRNWLSNKIIRPLNAVSDIVGNMLVGKFKKTYTDEQYNLSKVVISDDVKTWIAKYVIDNKFYDIINAGLSRFDERKLDTISKKGQQGSASGQITDAIIEAIYTDITRSAMFGDNALDSVVQFIFKLQSDDKAIKKSFVTYLGKLLTSQNIDLNKGYTVEVTQMIVSAYNMASYDFVHRSNIFDKLGNTLYRSNKGAYIGYKLIMPFASSSWNWFKEALNLTPVGLIGNLRKLITIEQQIDKLEEARRKGDFAGIDPRFVEMITRRNIGKGVIGTVLFALGMALAAFGKIRIDRDDDKLKLYVGDHFVDISNVYGTSSLLLGAMFTQPDKGSFYTVLKDAFDMSFQDTVFTQLMDSFRYGYTPSKYLENAIPNLVLGFWPNLFKSITRAINYKQISYSNGLKGALEYFIYQTIPGSYNWLNVSIDPFTGEEEVRYSNKWYIRVFNLVSPASLKEYKPSDVELEYIYLNKNLNELAGDYKDIGKLDKNELNKKYGELNAKYLNDLINDKIKYTYTDEYGKKQTKVYSKLTYEQKKSALSSITAKNANYAKIYVWTNSGHKYYCSSDKRSELLKLGIYKNVYVGNKGFVK